MERFLERQRNNKTSRTNTVFGGDGCSDFAFEFRYDYEM